MPVKTQIQMRRDTAANWTSTNPTLASGEWGLETDTKMVKVGNGTTAWNSLAYNLGPVINDVLPFNPTGPHFDGTGLRVYGLLGHGASTPDSNALDITGDLDVRVKIAFSNWSAGGFLVSKFNDAGGGTNNSYHFRVDGSGLLRLFCYSGVSAIQPQSTVAVPFSNGETGWVRATVIVNNGSGNGEFRYYTSKDGVNWTQLGNTILTSTFTMAANSTPLFIGGTGAAFGLGTCSTATFYRVQVRNGVDGTIVFDANFENVPADSFAMTESSYNAATVTLSTNRYTFGLPGLEMQSTNLTTKNANADYYNIFHVGGSPITVRHWAFEVTSNPASASTIYMGIYRADANMQPYGEPLYSSSAITASVAGIYRVRVEPFTLTQGFYIMATICSVNTACRQFIGGPTFITSNLPTATPFVNHIQPRTRPTTTAYGSNPLQWMDLTLAATGPTNWAVLGWTV